VCPLENSYIFVLSLGVLPSEFVALRLPEMHDETHKQITICNDDCKFAVYSHSILYEFAVKNVVMIKIHSKRFFLRTVRQLHAQHTCPTTILRRITYITDELDFSWDPDIGFVFSGADSTLFYACAFLDLLSTAANPSWRPVLHPPPWFRFDTRSSVPRPPPWPD